MVLVLIFQYISPAIKILFVVCYVLSVLMLSYWTKILFWAVLAAFLTFTKHFTINSSTPNSIWLSFFLLNLFRMVRPQRPQFQSSPGVSPTLWINPLKFWLLVLTIFPHCGKVSRQYLVPIQNYWIWTEIISWKKLFSWSNLYQIEVIITSFIKLVVTLWLHKHIYKNMSCIMKFCTILLISSKLQSCWLKQPEWFNRNQRKSIKNCLLKSNCFCFSRVNQNW